MLVTETLIPALGKRGKQIFEVQWPAKLAQFAYSQPINDIISNEVDIIPKNDS